MNGQRPGMKKTERPEIKNSVVESHGQTDGIEHKVINFYHKASTMEEVLNNHTIKMSWTTGATFCYQSPQNYHYWHMRTVDMVAETEAMYGANSMHSHLPKKMQLPMPLNILPMSIL